MTESHEHYRESDPTRDPRIAAELAAGEELVWAGRPVLWLRLRKSALVWLVSVPLAVVGVLLLKAVVIGFSESEMPQALDVIFRVVFGIIAVILAMIGITLLFYPLVDYRKANRELFALTTKRCIVWCRTDGDFEAKSLATEQLRSMYREIDSKGRGNLVLGLDPNPEFDEDEPEEDRDTIGFYGIESVREVEQLIRETLGVPEEADAEPPHQ
ncbi:MAG: hypothetical protein ACF8MJ_03245 [Phycisphaerales bacterium JB050]